MREPSTLERKRQLWELLKEDRVTQFCRLRWWDDEYETWRVIEDEKSGIDTQSTVDIPQYANYSRTPIASTAKFVMLDPDGEYSPETDTEKSEILRNNRKVDISWGILFKNIDDGELQSVTGHANDMTLFHAAYSATPYRHVSPSIELGSGQVDRYFQDFFQAQYGKNTYGEENYTPAGYAFYRFDRQVPGTDRFVALSVFTFAESSSKGNIYYRAHSDADGMDNLNNSSSWVDGGAIYNGLGIKEIELDYFGYRYLDVAVVFTPDTWDETVQAIAFELYYYALVEWFPEDEYLLDDPLGVEPAAPEMPYVDCEARNIWKKALESDITLPDISGQSLNTIISWVCVRSGIPAGSFADLGEYGNRTIDNPYENAVNASDVLQNVMEIIGDNYEMIVKNGELTVQAKDTDYEVDFIADYNYYSDADKKKVSDKQIRRISVVSSSESVDDEAVLTVDSEGASNGTYDDDTTIPVSSGGDGIAVNREGDFTVTWGTESAFHAFHKRFTVSDTAVKDYLSVVSFGNLSITINVAEDCPLPFDFTLYGCFFSDSLPIAHGEWVNAQNMIDNIGKDSVIENPLLVTNGEPNDNEALDVAKNHVDEYGNPVYQINVKYPRLIPHIEIGDTLLLWSRLFFKDNIYRVVGVKHSYDDGTNGATTLTLNDTGRNFSDTGDFVYDRTPTKMLYDIGYKYEMILGPRATAADRDLTKYKLMKRYIA